MEVDPKITVSEALELFDGNQSALARKLNISRAWVSDLVRQEEIGDRTHLPPLQAYRLAELFPDKFPKNSVA